MDVDALQRQPDKWKPWKDKNKPPGGKKDGGKKVDGKAKAKAKGKGPGGGAATDKDKAKKKIKCFICGGDHLKKDCPKKKEKGGQ